ncbi:MAG TPA: hypothetical protein P5234_07980 [Thermoanaerobaculaceae bacterium]|nr:hypothetical protein [Thermoanaerobaculaceae bacterium]HRS16177.1 hypothetical protein [Thermoanaerobaculaceae bacterium]
MSPHPVVRVPERLQKWLPAVAAAVAVAALLASVLELGAVAEDYQFAVDGARTAAEPSRLLQPFQLVWRPGARLPFVLWAAAGGESFLPLRLLHWLGGTGLVVLAWAALRRVVGLPGPLAATLAAWWIASVLGSGLVVGETAFLGHVAMTACSLGALLVVRPEMTPRRGVALGALALGAAACHESWVMLPVAVVGLDALVHRLPARRVVRRALPWAGFGAAYLLAYGAITGFAYRGLYAADAATIGAKLLVSAAMLVRTHPIIGLDFPAALAEAPWSAAAALVLLAALGAGLARLGRPRVLWFVGAMLLFGVPTLASPEQSSRWLALPWLGVLAAVGAVLADLWRAGRPWRWVTAGLALPLAALAAADAHATRSELGAWRDVAVLTRQLEAELPAVLQGARPGRVLVVLRHGDGEPLARITARLSPRRAAFFPRPDDPYGIVSLSALLSWHGRAHGLAFRRVDAVPAGAEVLAWRHFAGGFQQLRTVPPVRVRHPDHPGEGAPGVILLVEPWASFDARTFP